MFYVKPWEFNVDLVYENAFGFRHVSYEYINYSRLLWVKALEIDDNLRNRLLYTSFVPKIMSNYDMRWELTNSHKLETYNSMISYA